MKVAQIKYNIQMNVAPPLTRGDEKLCRL
jgi:hypothetical protein